MKTNYMIGIVGVVLLALMLIPNVVLADTSVSVTISKYEPYPATPGQTVKVWLLVQNNGDSDAKDLSVNVIPQAPFSLYNQDSMTNISILGAKKDYLIDYNLKVDDNAVEGNNNLRVVYSYDTAQGQVVDLPIFVQAKDSSLTIDSVKMTPTEIVPGSDGTLTITVKNNAPSTMTDLSMQLQL